MITKNLLIIEDHSIISDSLKSYLKDRFNKTYVGNSEVEAKKIIVNSEIDIIILDLLLKDKYSFDILNFINIKYPSIKVIILSTLSNTYYIKRCLEYNVCKGYFSKNTHIEKFLIGIDRVLKGENVNSVDIDELLSHTSTKRSINDRNSLFSDRELQVIKEMYNELSNPEIAEKLAISVRTVEVHKRNILHKIGAKNTVGVIRFIDDNKDILLNPII